MRARRNLDRLASRQLALVLLVGCHACSFVRPEGDGGWTAQQRRQEISRAVTVAPSAQAAAGSAMVSSPALLDLATVLRLVREHNQRIAHNALELAAAEQRVYDVRGRFLPATTGSARYTWYSSAQSVTFPPELAGQLPQLQTPPRVTLRAAEAGTFNATVLLPIDLSGELRHALRAAQAGYRGERARLWTVTLEQETAAVRAYFQLLEARRLLAVTDQTRAQVLQQLTQTQGKLDNGRVTKNELLVIQVALRNLDQQRMQRRLAVDQARWLLNQLTGRSIDSDAEIADVTRQPDVPTLPELLRSMQEHNPMAAALLEEQQRLDATATSLARSRWPRFSGGGAIDYTTMDIIEPQRMESAFVGVTLDLGTDLRREAQIAAARVAAEKNRVALAELLQELETAVRSTHAAMLERVEALQTAQTAASQAEENRRIRQQQFDGGRIESDKVLEAESLLDAQRAAAASALYQAHTRRAELQQLIGLPLQDLLSSAR